MRIVIQTSIVKLINKVLKKQRLYYHILLLMLIQEKLLQLFRQLINVEEYLQRMMVLKINYLRLLLEGLL